MYKKSLLLLFVLFLIPKTTFAYTITYNSTFGKFSNGSTENVVEYDENHNVINGTYEEPNYNNGIETSNFISWYSEYDAKNRVSVDNINSDIILYAAYEKVIWNFDYTGEEQVFSLPIRAGLQLKVWGAQGGGFDTDYIGGYGGYSTGLYNFNANQNIYVNVGGAGSLATGINLIAQGGYNGGGNGNTTNRDTSKAGGGGGATHIATKSGLLSDLSLFQNTIAIVAGGGGGSIFSSTMYHSIGQANAGGYIGGYNISSGFWGPAQGGTQSSGFAFGLGQSYSDSTTQIYVAGAGAGWYGGTVTNYTAGGGSGYIGNTIENTRHMTMYSDDNNYASDEDSTKTILTSNVSDNAIDDYVKIGNGYAKLELNRLNITYINEFDETNIVKDQYVGSLAQDLSITQRDGYESAWYYGDTKWNFETPVNSDITLEAKYTKVTYDITYDLNGGTVSGENPNTYEVDSNDIILINPTKENFDFLGWFGTGLSEPTTNVTISSGSTGNREYVANFELTNYVITYDLDGGVLPEEITNLESYNIETPTFGINNPTKQGYTFVGWTGSNGDEPEMNIIIENGSTGNKTYKANYSRNTFIVTFDSKGGTYIAPQIIAEETKIENIPTPTKEGYLFNGWTNEDGKSINDEITENILFEANWVKQFNIKSGDNQFFYKDSDNDIVIVSDGLLEDFKNFKIYNNNGVLINMDDLVEGVDYELETGSTKLILKNSFLKTLSVENYNVEFTYYNPTLYGSGQTDAKLTVKEGTNSVTTTEAVKVNSPKTGDNILKYELILILSLISLCILKIKKIKVFTEKNYL